MNVAFGEMPAVTPISTTHPHSPYSSATLSECLPVRRSFGSNCWRCNRRHGIWNYSSRPEVGGPCRNGKSGRVRMVASARRCICIIPSTYICLSGRTSQPNSGSRCLCMHGTSFLWAAFCAGCCALLVGCVTQAEELQWELDAKLADRASLEAKLGMAQHGRKRRRPVCPFATGVQTLSVARNRPVGRSGRRSRRRSSIRRTETPVRQ